MFKKEYPTAPEALADRISFKYALEEIENQYIGSYVIFWGDEILGSIRCWCYKNEKRIVKRFYQIHLGIFLNFPAPVYCDYYQGVVKDKFPATKEGLEQARMFFEKNWPIIKLRFSRRIKEHPKNLAYQSIKTHCQTSA